MTYRRGGRVRFIDRRASEIKRGENSRVHRIQRGFSVWKVGRWFHLRHERQSTQSRWVTPYKSIGSHRTIFSIGEHHAARDRRWPNNLRPMGADVYCPESRCSIHSLGSNDRPVWHLWAGLPVADGRSPVSAAGLAPSRLMIGLLLGGAGYYCILHQRRFCGSGLVRSRPYGVRARNSVLPLMGGSDETGRLLVRNLVLGCRIPSPAAGACGPAHRSRNHLRPHSWLHLRRAASNASRGDRCDHVDCRRLLRYRSIQQAAALGSGRTGH